MVTNSLLSFWLIPDAANGQIFQPIIEQLAQQHHSEPFNPHVTLHCAVLEIEDNHPSAASPASRDGYLLSELSANNQFDHLMSTLEVEPLTLAIEGIRYGQEFSKTVFVQLRLSPQLLDLVCQIRRIFRGSDQNYDDAAARALPPIDPHLSLLYQDLADEQKQAIAQSLDQSINVSQRFIRFDRLQIIKTPLQFQTQDDVRSLSCLYTHALSI